MSPLFVHDKDLDNAHRRFERTKLLRFGKCDPSRKVHALRPLKKQGKCFAMAFLAEKLASGTTA